MTPKKTILALSVLLLFGCSGGGPRSDSGTAATAMVDAPSKKTTTQAIERKIIYSGDLDLVCDNLDSASSKLEAQVKAFNGYVGSATRATATGEVRTATWEIRVPSANFSAFLKAMGSVGDVRSSSVKADDVSEEYYDAQAHLRNKQVEENRLLDLLKRDSGNLSNILTVEKELSRVRGEVEEIQGRLRFLDNQTQYSTLTVKIEEIADFSPASPNLNTEVGRTFVSSAISLEIVLRGLLLAIVALVPWLIPIGACVVLVRWLSRRFFRTRGMMKPPIQVNNGED